MNDITLSKIEKKCLYAIKRYPCADIGLHELNGYLHFPPIEEILAAIGKLEKHGFISKKEPQWHGYQIEEAGKQYMQKHRLFYSKIWPIIKKIIWAVITAVISVVVARLIP